MRNPGVCGWWTGSSPPPHPNILLLDSGSLYPSFLSVKEPYEWNIVFPWRPRPPLPRTSEEPDAHFFDPAFLVCCTLTSVSAEMKKLMNLSSGFNFSPEAAQVGTFFCQQQQLFPPPHILTPTYKTCLDPLGWRLTFRFLSWWGQRIVRFLLLCF